VGLRASPAPTQVKPRAPTDHLILSCRNEGLLFSPRHVSRYARGQGMDMKSTWKSTGLFDPCPVILVLTLQAIPN
jgi:hypothetical protein